MQECHKIEITENGASIAYAGETPWHGLGRKVPADLTPEQMLEAAQLDWSVERVPTYANVNGKYINTGREALVRDRDSKVLDIVGPGWNPVQNAEAFGFFYDFVNEGKMQMHTAGALEDGRIVWALAKMNEGFTVFGKDDVESYLLFTNPHKYGKSIDVRFTPIRVVCNNTLTLAINTKSASQVSINHRAVFSAEAVKETLGISKEKMAKYKEAAEYLGSKKYTDETFNVFLKRVFNVDLDKPELSRPARQVLEIVDTQPGAEFKPGSWWNAYNAVTYATDHLLGRSADTRLKSAWYGSNANRKHVALNTAIEMAEAS
jgi:phage/plasmid-like protein (TIGR03299 family)